MEEYQKKGFISLGCRTDRDCVYRNEDGSEEFNFQSCRAYPSKLHPLSNSTMNGCICLNYIVSADVDTSTGRVHCIKNDSGTLTLYTVDIIMIFFQLIIFFRGLYIMLIFGRVKLNQLKRMGMKRDKPISLVKRHGLLCLIFLMMACLSFSIYRILSDVGYMKGLKVLVDNPTKQERFDRWPIRILVILSYTFFGLCGLHFTILWLSTTKALFSQEAERNSGSCFNVKMYKRFINAAEILFAVSAVTLASMRVGTIVVNFVIFTAAIVIIHEFVWGCRNITRLLKLIASWPNTSRVSSNSITVGTHGYETATKLLSVAEKIDKFSSQMRKVGFFAMLFFAIYILLDFLGL